MKKLALTFDYDEMLSQAVNQIRNGRNYLAKQLSSTISSVYWNLGKLLFDRHLEEGYGSGVVKQLSADLKREFPDMGLSPRNLWYMKRLYERYYQSDTKLQRSIAVLPWRHNILLLDKQVTDEEVIFYSNEVIEKGWSQEMLLNAIKMNTFAFQQQQQKSNNFEETLPKLHAEFANEVFKNSYNFGSNSPNIRNKFRKTISRTYKTVYLRTRERLFVYWQSISLGIQQQRVFCRYAFFS